MRDRDQKAKALQLSIAQRWLPQLEVAVHPGRPIRRVAPLVTDLDVYSSIPDEFRGYRLVVFDCKTRARESPVNRSLWLAGVLQRLRADQGFCILRRGALELEHRLMATQLGIIVLGEDEFDLYAHVTSKNSLSAVGHVGDLALWDLFFAIPDLFPRLRPGVEFLRSTYWMIDDSAQACRKTLACLRQLHPELDPGRSEHMCLFLDACALFARSLAIVATHVFRAYLHPTDKGALAEALLMMLYGGRDAYEHRNQLFRIVENAKRTAEPAPDLTLPEWERFLSLVRQLLDAPGASQFTPLILRELAFTSLSGDGDLSFAKQLCSEQVQAARFASLVPSYLAKASLLPPAFAAEADRLVLPLIPVR